MDQDYFCSIITEFSHFTTLNALSTLNTRVLDILVNQLTMYNKLLGEVSIIALFDSTGCGDESVLGYPGLIIWTFLLLFIMVRQFVICEELFVPVVCKT